MHLRLEGTKQHLQLISDVLVVIRYRQQYIFHFWIYLLFPPRPFNSKFLVHADY